MCQRHLLNRAEDVEAIIDRPRGTSATNLLPYGAKRVPYRAGNARPYTNLALRGKRGSNFLAIPRPNPDWAEDRGTNKCWERNKERMKKGKWKLD